MANQKAKAKKQVQKNAQIEENKKIKEEKAKLKAEAEAKAKEEAKKLEEIKKKEEEIAQRNDHLSFYTLFAMLYLITSAGAAILGMVVWTKPSFYILDFFFGKNFYPEDIDLMDELNIKEELPGYVSVFALVTGILFIIATVAAIVIMVRAMDATKRPALLLSILSTVLIIVGVVLFAINTLKIKARIDDTELLINMKDYISYRVNAYIVGAGVFVVNLIVSIINVVGCMVGTKKHKAEGRAY